jgi:cation diffusion facilitator family transporter
VTTGPKPATGASSRFDRDAKVIRILWWILVLNLTVAALKLLFGYFAGSVSMLADGLHSILDSSSNVVGLAAIHIARKGPDDTHPYGHRKFETLASLAIATFLFATSVGVLNEVIRRFQGEHQVEPRVETFVVMGITLLISATIARYERRAARELRSSILMADSRHTQSDVYVTIGVLVSLVAAVLNFPIMDIVVGLLIVVFIAYSGVQIVRGSLSVLSDAQAIDPEDIVRVAMQSEEVLETHRVRSRGVPGDIHVDLHLHLPPNMTTARAHEVAHEVSHRIRSEFADVIDVVIHVEPHGHEEHDGPEEPGRSTES